MRPGRSPTEITAAAAVSCLLVGAIYIFWKQNVNVIEGTQLVMEDAQMIRRKKTNGTRLENGSALTLFKVKEKNIRI